ncbi:MAG TPA: Ig-like domain-containing protein, partial [Candidatus Thermoplasmatota archaeon]
DAGGNTRTVVFDLRVDVSPPSYSLDPSSAAGLVRTSPWTLTVTTEAGAEVFVDGAAIAPTAPGGGTFAGQVALREGPNVVNLTVVDAAGNRRDVSLVLTLDTQAPSLTVSTPEDGARVAQDTVRVAGTAEAGALVTVGGSPAVVDAAGRFAVDYPLVRGENTVVVEATDPAGNTARVTRVVTREGGGGGGITGVDFIDDNLYFLLLLIALAAVGGALAARSRRKQRLLSDRATALSREIDTSVNLRGDLGAMDDFSPRRVNDPDFQSFEDFQRRQGGRPPGP